MQQLIRILLKILHILSCGTEKKSLYKYAFLDKNDVMCELFTIGVDIFFCCIKWKINIEYVCGAVSLL